MVAAIPLMLWMARKSPLTASDAAGSRSQSSSSWLQVRRCSLLSVRNSAAYFGSIMAASAQDALDRFEDPGRLEGLHHEILGPGLDRLDDQCLLAHRAAHENLRVGILLADLAHGLDPTHVGHDDVHRHEVGLELAVLLHGLQPRFRLADDLEAGLIENVADHRAHEDRVIADEHRVTHCPPPSGSGLLPAMGASSASMSSRMK